MSSPIQVTRTGTILRPEQSRVLLRPFNPGDAERASSIIKRIMQVPDEDVGQMLKIISTDFAPRHKDLHGAFLERFDQVCAPTAGNCHLSHDRRLLIGAYFMAEYSLESAALFNPSIVRHPDQTGMAKGDVRFILSLRATGEGHISSITFRTGVIYSDHRIEVFPPMGCVSEPRQIPNPFYEKPLFERKLIELGHTHPFVKNVLARLGFSFGLEELRAALNIEHGQRPGGLTAAEQNAAQSIWLLARANHDVQFQADQDLSERILFPATPSQRNGIEDARFVHFQDDDGTGIYYATFTAYDGRTILPELVETTDFLRFRFITLNGPAAENKGMALFPRKIDGKYAMLSRQGAEDVSIMFSDNIHFWNERKVILEPEFPWELVQMGNCGSPIETDAGWLVLSHGVGPVRKYCIGAFLLDRDDPTKVIGRLKEPLLMPNEDEREGYVPNVVYTCGFLLHEGTLIIPYGLADHATGFVTAPLQQVLDAMTTEGCAIS
jgi:predicted GH43/DUF377 family glycosyl hydrolase